MREYKIAAERVSDFLTSTIDLEVNGKKYRGIKVKPYDTLSRVLREELGLTGTKRGCDYGGCGACTVAIDGRSIYSCMYPAQYAEGKKILTVEGLAKGDDELSEIQRSFLEKGGLQCGYCTSGILVSTKILLEGKLELTELDIKEALAGNICRCTGYNRILESIFAAAKANNMKKNHQQ
jgi:aerobic carbon-monoxide dehydrogenase small subunit